VQNQPLIEEDLWLNEQIDHITCFPFHTIALFDSTFLTVWVARGMCVSCLTMMNRKEVYILISLT